MYKKETSYGIIPIKKLKNEWKVLLVKHGKGHWAFPKGHPEAGEAPQETAQRELKEETGLDIVSFLEIPELKEHYMFRHGELLIDKTAIYFAAFTKGSVKIQQAEISDFRWLTLEEAEALITFKESKRLCAEMKSYWTLLTRSRIPGKRSS